MGGGVISRVDKEAHRRGHVGLVMKYPAAAWWCNGALYHQERSKIFTAVASVLYRRFKTVFHPVPREAGDATSDARRTFPCLPEHRLSLAKHTIHVKSEQYLARRSNMDVEKALEQEKERCDHAEHLNRKQVRQ